jgi:glycosyltransferase involved in cell wall biosynthesis
LTVGDPALSNPHLDGYLRRVTPRAAAALMVGPFLHARIRAIAPQLPLFYDMHDDYAEYVGRMAGPHRDRAHERLAPIERGMIADCRAIFCVSPEDADSVRARHPEAASKLHLAPNGVATARVFRAYPSESLRLARELRLTKPLILFVGSVLRANLRAMSFIIEKLAPAAPEALFAILGVARAELAQQEGAKTLPPNVVFCGRVSESEKEALFALACLALAPMGEGTGSSLKIPDYVAHGKPVISTPIGLRGYGVLRSHVDVVELDEFAATVKSRVAELMNRNDALDARAAAAWEVVRDKLDWSVIGRDLIHVMQPHLRVNV